MAKAYPLYDELLKRVTERNNKETEGVDINSLCNTINNISLHLSNQEALEHYTEIGALIYHHGVLENNGEPLAAMPYNPKIMIGGKGILNYITSLPPMLQHIVAQYIQDEAYPKQG